MIAANEQQLLPDLLDLLGAENFKALSILMTRGSMDDVRDYLEEECGFPITAHRDEVKRQVALAERRKIDAMDADTYYKYANLRPTAIPHAIAYHLERTVVPTFNQLHPDFKGTPYNRALLIEYANRHTGLTLSGLEQAHSEINSQGGFD